MVQCINMFMELYLAFSLYYALSIKYLAGAK